MKLFRRLAKLTSWIIPSKQCRSSYKDLMSYLDLRNDIITTHNNYKNVVSKIRNKIKTEKIKVIFLIRENQKWTYQSLYEQFEKSDKFEPLVLISLLDIVRSGKDKTRNHIEEDYHFFKSKGINVDYAFKDGKYIDLKQFNPDIVFYDQPWELPKKHMPNYVSQFALTCYCSYSYELIDNREHYLSSFHRYLYKIFVDDNLNLERYEKYMKGNSDNCTVTGYPKLDEYIKSPKECSVWKHKDKFKIIYAPHHSFEKNGIHFATFMQNYRLILDLAKSNPDTEWIFKPHPRLKYALLRNNLLSKKDIDDYYGEWGKIGTIFDTGDYFDIFKTSDLMITDSISFLAEYLPSKKPLIRLINSKSAKMNQLGELINQGYYLTHDNTELKNTFNELVINKNDTKKEERIKLIDTVLNINKSAAENICNHLISCLEVIDD